MTSLLQHESIRLNCLRNIAVLMLENHFLVNVLLMCGTVCHQILLISVRYAHLKGQLK